MTRTGRTTTAILLGLGLCACGTRRVEPAPRAVAISAGGAHACALLEGGAIECWGANDAGQLGDGSREDRPTPVRFGADGAAAADLFAGFATTCARDPGGAVRCSGAMLPGALGAPPGVRGIDAFTGARQVGVGRLHGCVVDGAGAVSCWGSNYFGQLGDGSARGCAGPPSSGRAELRAVPGLAGVESIAVGDTGTCAVLVGGGVRCWGVVGLAGDAGRCAPAAPEGLEKVRRVAVGAHHGCALLEGGAVECWGANAVGQLGALREPPAHGAAQGARLGPLPVLDLADAEALASFGRAHTCALRRGGQVVCWGRNAEGQLGDGTTTSRFRPVAVAGLGDAVAIAAGYDSTCALRRGGRVACWGANDRGQLGDGTTRARTSPVEVGLVSPPSRPGAAP